MNHAPVREARRFGAGLVTAALALAAAAGLGAPAAWAGPDDGKFVATQTHIDSPKVFWEGDNFKLYSQIWDQKRPIEDTVNWVGKAREGGSADEYIFEVGKTMVFPDQEFLGKEGDLLYYASQYSSQTTPIWIGFGADGAIPVDQLRDDYVDVEIVGFDGPGRMEIFDRSFDENTSAQRLWSSHDPALRDLWMSVPLHQHVNTTFTKPGRYEVTYRATARTKDGQLIASEPQTMAWQVGGTNPADSTIGDIATAYNAASNTGGGDFSFTLAPHEADGGAIAGEEYLTDLTLDTGNATDAGTAVFYLDGYHLAEVPVVGGKATWPEMIGSYSSKFQAVYIPDGASESPRWVSEQVNYDRSMPKTTTRSLGAAYPTPASQDVPPEFDFGEMATRSNEVTVGAERVGDYVRITATPADDRLALHVAGGVHEGTDGTYDDAPSCSIEFTSTPAQRSFTTSMNSCIGGDYQIRLGLTPRSAVTVGGTEAVVPRVGDSVSVYLGGVESPHASPGANRELIGEPVELDRGHIDLGPVAIGDDIVFALGDDTWQFAQQKVFRDPESVTMVVGEEHKVSAPGVGDYAFLGKKGAPLYLLAQTQTNGSLWPGFSSEYGDYEPWDFEIEPVSGPEGGKWWAYTDGLGGIAEHLASSEGPSRIERSYVVHLHNNWVFNAPGTYTIKMRAVRHDGTDETNWSTVTFRVGEVSAEPTPTTPAEPTPNPTLNPTPNPTLPGPAQPSDAGLDATEVQLSKGHIDLGPVAIGDDILFALGDDTWQLANQKVYRDPEAVTMVVGEEHKVSAPGTEAFAFLGEKGTPLYLLPQTQRGGSLWPGFSSEYGDHEAWDFEIEPASAPEGGKWWAYTDGLTGINEHLASSEGPSTIERSQVVHLHNNWVFSAPGTYTIKMRAVRHDGSKETNWSTVTFQVGKAGAEPTTEPSTEPTPSTTPDPTSTEPVPAQPTSTEPTPAEPTTTAPTPTLPGPEQPTITGLDATQVELSEGHIDLGPVAVGDDIVYALGDETWQHSQNKVYRDPAAVTMVVGDDRLIDLPAGEDYAFLGTPGDRVYGLPATQRDNSLWPGFSSQHADGSGWDFEFAPATAPEGGQWLAYTTGTFGAEITEVFGSSQGPTTVKRSGAVHMHNNWIFTKPGTYTMKMRAVRNDGSKETDWATVAFRVGGTAPVETPVDPGPSTGASPSATPGAQPSPGTPPGNTNPSAPITGPVAGNPPAAGELPGAPAAAGPGTGAPADNLDVPLPVNAPTSVAPAPGAPAAKPVAGGAPAPAAGAAPKAGGAPAPAPAPAAAPAGSLPGSAPAPSSGPAAPPAPGKPLMPGQSGGANQAASRTSDASKAAAQADQPRFKTWQLILAAVLALLLGAGVYALAWYEKRRNAAADNDMDLTRLMER